MKTKRQLLIAELERLGIHIVIVNSPSPSVDELKKAMDKFRMLPNPRIEQEYRERKIRKTTMRHLSAMHRNKI